MRVDTWGPDHDHFQEFLYLIHMMEGRGFSGSFPTWMIGGRITRSSLQKLRQTCRRAGIPIDATVEEAAHAEIGAGR